ncbi:hypothetical protein NHP190003_02170 [Helicobacter sp. NHP19-003]|uniref:Lipoprotein n=1 Tax=Helicobacter gastrocanis TaxID=2849641 RepID=A0ABN6HZW7_9HELI|nr:hypothetical protein [Helicobacter sp. NHP19-003]BCZ16935.1 hypothetical protein NHP190003_02170 [Helicobacter sp. NHP19-003]
MEKHALSTALLATLLITGCTQSTPAKNTTPNKPAAAQKTSAQSTQSTKKTTQQSNQQNQDDDINYERPLIRGKK